MSKRNSVKKGGSTVAAGAADSKASFPGVDAEHEAKRLQYQQAIEELSTKAPEKVAPYVKKAAPYLALAAIYFLIALPYIQKGIHTAVELYGKLPQEAVWAVLGFLMCFFGGVFPATIAAVEAWRVAGGVEAWRHVKTLYGELQKVDKANKEDDKTDADGDGIPDVNQIDGKHLLARKVGLVLKTTDPATVNTAMIGLYTGWLGVLATLKIQFAMTMTLGASIGEKIYQPAQTFVEPALLKVVPDEYHKWVPISVHWACKAWAISIAWWIQRVISAFHSSVRGGHIFASYFLQILRERGFLPPSLDGALMGEGICWAVAGLGFLWQWSTGFTAPFIFNIFLFPINMVESFIVWSVAAQF